MGQRLKTTLPTTAGLPTPPQRAREIKHILEKMKEKEKQQYDGHCGRELPSLHTGNVIRMQHGNNGKQQQSYSNPYPDLMLFRHLMESSIAEIRGTYMS